MVESARARLQNTASPQLSFVAVDGKSAEINGIIAALVQLLFDFQVHICVHVHVCGCVPRRGVTSRVSFQFTQPDRSKGSNLVLLWAQTRGNAAYSKRVITQSDVSEETPPPPLAGRAGT